MPQVDAFPHPSFETVWKSLGSFRRPQTPFDPEGAWTHEYQIGAPVFAGDEFAPAPVGKLTLEREPGSGAAFQLRVRSQVKLETSAITHVAQLDSIADLLATPRAWSVEETITGYGGATVLATTNEGAEQPGTTSNWSLFEAFQRLQAAEAAPFTLLEDLRTRKHPQRIVPAGDLAFSLAGDELRLRGHRLIGAGNLPWHFWIDEHGRLLFVLSPLKTYVLRA